MKYISTKLKRGLFFLALEKETFWRCMVFMCKDQIGRVLNLGVGFGGSVNTNVD